MMDKANFFKIHEYVDLLKDKKTICIKDFKKFKNGILVRHDVDYSLDMAYRFSRYEKENNINSTYYILLTTDLYNVFSLDSQRKINQMIKDGFEIGIHFDPIVYGDLEEKELIEKLKIEIWMFESFFNIKIHSYSMHNPSSSGIYINHPDLINAYDSRIFSNENYISDSSYSFRDKDPRKFIQKSSNKLIQFLTHPVHFFSNGEISYEQQLNTILNKYYANLDAQWSVNRIYSSMKKDYIIKINEEV